MSMVPMNEKIAEEFLQLMSIKTKQDLSVTPNTEFAEKMDA